MDINKFFEGYVDNDEPTTKEKIFWAVQKYIYMSVAPSLQDKIEMYEAFQGDLTKYLELNEADKVKKLLSNLSNYDNLVRAIRPHVDPLEVKAQVNEAFFNLRKI